MGLTLLFGPLQLTPQNGNWFLNPKRVPWLDDLSEGAARLGRGIVHAPAGALEAGHTVLKSPLFWETIILGGAATGGYYLLKDQFKNNAGNSGNAVITSERSCVGARYCDKCTSCNYCAHCQNMQTPCGTFYAVRGLKSP